MLVPSCVHWNLCLRALKESARQLVSCATYSGQGVSSCPGHLSNNLACNVSDCQLSMVYQAMRLTSGPSMRLRTHAHLVTAKAVQVRADRSDDPSCYDVVPGRLAFMFEQNSCLPRRHIRASPGMCVKAPTCTHWLW